MFVIHYFVPNKTILLSNLKRLQVRQSLLFR